MRMFKTLPNTVLMAHQYLINRLYPGCIAVDATVGNGHDTLLLARLVSPGGKVYGFDIQAEAISNTSQMLNEHGYSNVELFHTGHENMSRHITEHLDAVVFNLGYRPGGDHEVITKPETTLQAVVSAMQLTRPGGIVVLVVYTGHPGGATEQEALEGFLSELDKKDFCVGKFCFINRLNAPYLIVIEKSL